MNVRQQGPGGLLMLFACGATLQHLGRTFSWMRDQHEAGAYVGSLFVVAVLFLLLGLFKQQWLRNVTAFILAAVVLVTMMLMEIRHHGQRYISRAELAHDATAARMLWERQNPYDGTLSAHEAYIPPAARGGSTAKLTPPFDRPAGSFLVQVPLVVFDKIPGAGRAGKPGPLDPRYLQLAFLLMTCLVLGTALGRNFFFLPTLLVYSFPVYLGEVVAGQAGFSWLLFIVLAWVVAPRRLISGLTAGLACAIHAAAWPITLFLIAIGFRESGWRVGLLLLLIVLVVFGGVNSAWIAKDAAGWGQAITDPLRSSATARDNVGLRFLEAQQLVPRLSDSNPDKYWALVGMIMLVLLTAYLLFPAGLYALGPVLGVLPMWAFWRSEMSGDLACFYFVPLLAMAGWASARIHPPELRFRDTPDKDPDMGDADTPDPDA